MAQKPDNVTAKNSGGFEPHSEGQIAALCVDVVDLGQKLEEFKGEKKVMPKVAIIFASGERHQLDGKPTDLALVTVEMTNSASDKGNLRKFLENWRGKAYTPAQIAEGLPLHKLQGNPALLTIEHILTKNGNKFAKVRSISPLPSVMPVAEGLLDAYTRPSFFADKKKAYAAALADYRNSTGGADPGPEIQHDEEDDDLPF